MNGFDDREVCNHDVSMLISEVALTLRHHDRQVKTMGLLKHATLSWEIRTCQRATDRRSLPPKRLCLFKYHRSAHAV